MGVGQSRLKEEEAQSAPDRERTSNQPSQQQQLLRENREGVGEEANPSYQQQQVGLEEGTPSNLPTRQENKPLAQAVEESKPNSQRSLQENKQLQRAAEEAGQLGNQLFQRENKRLPQVVEEDKSNLQRGQSKNRPRNYQSITKEADTAPLTDPHQPKSGGVFLNQNRKKHWIEEKTGANCFTLYARELSIAWADTPRYWSWSSEKETSTVDVEVAKLLNVCWLEVDGKFETSNLTPNTTYEVAFVAMIDDPAYGWNEPVTLKLVSPDGKVHERKEGLKQKARGEWMEIHVGDFKTCVDKAGEIQFTLLNYNSEWKKGLVVKGAVIRPKK